MPDILAGRSLAYDPWSVFYPPQEGILLLRDRIHARLQAKGLSHAPTASSWKVVFVSRADVTQQKTATDTGVRTLLNEHFLIDALRNLVGPDHFGVSLGFNMTVQAQLELFANAHVVLGLHGAGLANLVAAHPGTTFILFPMAPHVDNSFGHLAAALDLNTTVFTSLASNYWRTYPPITYEQVGDVVGVIILILCGVL
jgi:capsular polysaccharide biosynthesis protein